MNFKGTVTINAPREKVWAFLTDPTQLTECAPGLEKLDVIVPNEKFRAVASAGFGAIKATFVTDSRHRAGQQRRRHERDGAERRREPIDGAELVV
jgi:hypothetical protein